MDGVSKCVMPATVLLQRKGQRVAQPAVGLKIQESRLGLEVSETVA